MAKLLFIATVGSKVGEQLFSNEGLIQALEGRAEDLGLEPGTLVVDTTNATVALEMNGGNADVRDWIDFASLELSAAGASFDSAALCSAINRAGDSEVDARNVDAANFEVV